jgi:hypothetical protein
MLTYAGVCRRMLTRERAAAAGKLLMLLSRMAAATGEMWEALRADYCCSWGPLSIQMFRVDLHTRKANVEQRKSNGIQMLLKLLEEVWADAACLDWEKASARQGTLRRSPRARLLDECEFAPRGEFEFAPRTNSHELAPRTNSPRSLDSIAQTTRTHTPASSSPNSPRSRASPRAAFLTTGTPRRGVLYRSLKYDSNDYHMVGSLSYSILVVY